MFNLVRHLSGIANGVSIRLNKLCYSSAGEKEFMKEHPADYSLLLQNKELENLHKGKRCFIIGNGPSLNKQDLSPLANEYVFTVNHIYKHEQFKKVKTNYHFYMDGNCFNEELTPIDYFKHLNTDDNSPTVFFPVHVSESFVNKNNLNELYTCRYLFDFVPFDMNLPTRNNLTKGISGFYTVVQTAILAAVYMGFSEIYLLGCDCTGIMANINSMLNLDIKDYYAYKASNDDNKMFKKANAPVGVIQNVFLGWVNVFEGYNRILAFCQAKGVKLINATAGGILDSLPRADFDKLFN